MALSATPLPADTETLIERRGQPDLKVRVDDSSREDYLLLYEGDESDPEFDVDHVYYVDEDVGLTHRISVMDHEPKPTRRSRKRTKDRSDEQSWYQDLLRDARDQIKDLERRKEILEGEIHAMPGLNYFDRVDLLSKDMEVGWGKGRDETRTTFAFDTGRDTLSLTVQVPLP